MCSLQTEVGKTVIQRLRNELKCRFFKHPHQTPPTLYTKIGKAHLLEDSVESLVAVSLHPITSDLTFVEHEKVATMSGWDGIQHDFTIEDIDMVFDTAVKGVQKLLGLDQSKMPDNDESAVAPAKRRRLHLPKSSASPHGSQFAEIKRVMTFIRFKGFTQDILDWETKLNEFLEKWDPETSTKSSDEASLSKADECFFQFYEGAEFEHGVAYQIKNLAMRLCSLQASSALVEGMFSMHSWMIKSRQKAMSERTIHMKGFLSMNRQFSPPVEDIPVLPTRHNGIDQIMESGEGETLDLSRQTDDVRSILEKLDSDNGGTIALVEEATAQARGPAVEQTVDCFVVVDDDTDSEGETEVPEGSAAVSSAASGAQPGAPARRGGRHSRAPAWCSELDFSWDIEAGLLVDEEP